MGWTFVEGGILYYENVQTTMMTTNSEEEVGKGDCPQTIHFCEIKKDHKLHHPHWFYL